MKRDKGTALPRGPLPIEPRLAFYRTRIGGMVRRASDVLAAAQSYGAAGEVTAARIYSMMADLLNLGRRILQGLPITPEIETQVRVITAKLQRDVDDLLATLPTEEPKQ